MVPDTRESSDPREKDIDKQDLPIPRGFWPPVPIFFLNDLVKFFLIAESHWGQEELHYSRYEAFCWTGHACWYLKTLENHDDLLPLIILYDAQSPLATSQPCDFPVFIH